MSERILIVGSGEYACRAARELVALGRKVVVNCPETATEGCRLLAGPDCEILEGFTLSRADGREGAFSVQLRSAIGQRVLTAAHILLADNPVRQPAFADYGLAPSSLVRPLGLVRKALSEGRLDDILTDSNGSIVMLHGLHGESHPVMTTEVTACALELARQTDHRVFILTGNLKVAGLGLERRYRECRRAGIEIIKFTQPLPEIGQRDAGIDIRFTDPATGQRFGLSPVLTIVDERLEPGPAMTTAADKLGLEQDGCGFPQSDNVHRLTITTNRKGVFAIGPARTIQDRKGQRADLASLLLAVGADAFPAATTLAEIDPEKCGRCLTCVRSCPHVAIELEERPLILPEACQGCGICAASCPAGAIAFTRIDDSRPAVSLDTGPLLDRSEPSAGPVVVFHCSRSVLSPTSDAVLPGPGPNRKATLVEVPCGGSVSTGHLLAALEAGAAGVLVVTCHRGNCHAGPGPEHAAARTGRMQADLAAAGLEADRIAHCTTAANMPMEFGACVEAFAVDVRQAATDEPSPFSD